ncbi:MAG: glycosyltransferase family 2 protein [Succinivibrio sp.]|nr:glycosyltransferase family 2 protein [Succinivibrio sp.]
MRNPDYKVALIVPVYNEHETVETFVKTVNEKLAAEIEHIEIVFIDDGSSDNTVELIEKLQKNDKKISLIRLSRNFGKEAAMSAALDLVQSDAIVPIDVDLQDPPELVLEFIRIWRDEGIDTVYGVREDRSSDTNTKRVSSEGFYYVFNKMSGKVKIPSNVGDFRLIDRKIIDILKTLKERNRFMKALYAWPGFSSKGVGYTRPERVAGKTKWNYWKLWNFALDGIFAFSSLPLKIWSYIGGFIGLLSLIYMTWNIFKTMIFGNPTAGYTTLICVILFLGAVQLISIGILGEYVGRLSQEVKGRPVYVAQSITGPLAKKIPQGISSTEVGISYNSNENSVKKLTSKEEVKA